MRDSHLHTEYLLKTIWGTMTPNMRKVFLKIAGSVKGYPYAKVNKKTLDALKRRKIVFPVGSIVLPTYHGEALYNWHRRQGRQRRSS